MGERTAKADQQRIQHSGQIAEFVAPLRQADTYGWLSPRDVVLGSQQHGPNRRHGDDSIRGSRNKRQINRECAKRPIAGLHQLFAEVDEAKVARLPACSRAAADTAIPPGGDNASSRAAMLTPSP